MRKASIEEYQCEDCSYGSTRRSDFLRHRRRQHAKIIAESDSEWEKQNPGTLSDVIGEAKTPATTSNNSLMQGRTIRKPTHPAPVSSTKKSLLDTLRASIEPQRVVPKLPRTTATAVRATAMETDSSEDSFVSRSPLFYSSPITATTTTASVTMPVSSSTTSGQVASRRRDFGTQTDLASESFTHMRRVVRRRQTEEGEVEETEVWWD